MDMIVVIDFGGQYNQLIARRVRDMGVYSIILPYYTALEDILAHKPVGIILTGGPASVLDPDAPSLDPSIFEKGIPILGICYGCQLIGHIHGANVIAGDIREYGKTDIQYSTSPLFSGIEAQNTCWMSHAYHVSGSLPEGFAPTAATQHTPLAAFEDENKGIYALQFHPEVAHTPQGTEILRNFVLRVCKASQDWIMDDFAQKSIAALRQKIGDGKALCALSGGVDSSVAALLVHKAIGKNLTCIFVDNGLLRQGEVQEVEGLFGKEYGANFIRVDAKKRFLGKLEGITDPEQKRKIIGEEFIRVFEDEARKIGAVDFFVQGTIYPDVVESGTKTSALIKTHHNVGGLPDVIDFKEIIEPLRELFKDEVRKLGHALGMPQHVVSRQPFPGPGLAVRCIGQVHEDALEIIRKSDHILREEVAMAGLQDSIWQYFTVLPGVKTVGVMGDERTYGDVVAIRAVESTDAMTADWARLPYELLAKISTRIVNEVPGATRVVYDITSKPPGTIEWE